MTKLLPSTKPKTKSSKTSSMKKKNPSKKIWMTKAPSKTDLLKSKKKEKPKDKPGKKQTTLPPTFYIINDILL